MKKLHTYTRILLSLLLMLVTNVVMGQGLNEANIPIKNIAAFPDPIDDDHGLKNVYDGKEETFWSGARDDSFDVLEYMQIKNPDNNDNGRRSWVEIGKYVPNQNTEIEIVFQASSADITNTNKTSYIFGCGYPRYSSGMALGIIAGKYVFKTSNKEHKELAVADDAKHTIICSATSVKLDGVELMPGSNVEGSSGDDVITESSNPTGQHILSLFASPGDDQQWARNFNGKIYSVKIRENGKLLYDLVPANGWGRSGFYERISADMYGFFDMVDFVRNTNTADGDPQHIHYKIPYKMGNGTTTGHAWTGDLITNGQFSSSDIDKSFTIENDDWEPRVITPGGNKAIQILNDGSHLGGNSWDTSFTLNLDQELEADVEYELLFYCYAKISAKVRIQLGNGAWLAWLDQNFVGDGDYTVNDYVKFVPDWQERRIVIKGKDYSGKKIKSISFDFNTITGYNKYFLSNIRLRRKSDQVVIFEQRDKYDINSSCFGHRDDWKDRFQNIDGKTCLRVYNNGQLTGSEDYARKLDIKLPSGETFAPGDKYYISFYYKAENAGSKFGTQLQGNDGAYHSELKGNIDFGTSWQKVTWTGEIPTGAQSAVSSIGLKLNVTKTANTYYFTDIVVKKATKVTVPDTEVEIKYKNVFAPVKTEAVWGTPAPNGAWNTGANVYSWTGASNNLATVFETPDGKLANYKALNFNAADYVTNCPYRVCFMKGGNAVAIIAFYSAGQKHLVFSERTETKDLDLSTIDHIAFGGISESGSITVTNMYLTDTSEDPQSTRYLFSYNTREDKVLSLGIRDDQYQYTSGGVEGSIDFNPKNQIITTKFRPMEFEQDGVPFGIMGSPSWDKIVNNLYLFGTHSTTSDTYARSFVGEIYGAVIREGDVEKVKLQPACNNGVYGFYDLVTKTFYAKDTDNATQCGTSANFSGAAPVRHGDGLPKDGNIRPYSFTIDLASPKIVKNFYLTTASGNVSKKPTKFVLYGTTDGKHWDELTNENIAPTPTYSPMATDGTVQYLYNVETGTFMTGGNDWGTRATASYEKGNPVKIVPNGSTYRITDKPGAEWKDPVDALDCDGNKDSWVDGKGRDGDGEWQIVIAGDNIYNITNNQAGYIRWGVRRDMQDTRIVFNDDTSLYGTTWAFINEADYNDYMSSMTFKYPINNNNNNYSKFRFVVEGVVGGNTLALADLAFTSYFDFEHYVGRVYDSMGTPPDNLKVGGSSGYKQAYKMKGNAPDDPRLNEGVTIQRTHEYEHEIYLLPGETVDLTPFSDFGSTEWRAYNYMEQYVRWYDYRSDLRSNKLVFDKRDGLNVSTLDKGHFAWNLREDNQKPKDEWRRTREGSLAHYTADSNPTADANGVIDIIAIEAGGTFDWDKAEWNETKKAYVAKEPTLLWRHTFVIKDAKRRSDEMFASATANTNYINKHKIKLMCPANVPFQYPLPCQEYVGTGAERPTNYYYLKDDVYTPIYHYTIDTYKLNAEGTAYEKLGSRNHRYAGGSYSDEVMAQLAYPYKELDGYNRVFYIKNPEVGKYKIIINALGPAYAGGLRDQRIGSNDAVQIMMYELEVLAPADGVMITETELNSNSDYEHQRPANMKAAFGKPTTEVNFDDVRLDDLTPYSNDGVSGGYLKWPWQWEYSSYGFGYENRGDYNMYMITDIGGLTPFHGVGDRFRKIYDRLYNETNGTKKGYFFYANAASDPSRMSVLNIGKNFCPNTKVFVSAWINEFQGQDLYAETANVIFSFRGVKADGTETVLNSFVSGYVPGGWNTPYGYDQDGFVAAHNATTDSDGNETEPAKNPDNRGKWMHVYYTFKTDDAINFSEFDHYIITLENNCTSSEGADYAIDDICCYVRKPQVEASQLKPVCNGDPTTDLKIYADFDQMMDVFGFNEEDGTKSLYYCFLDRKVYEAKLKEAYDAGINDNSISSTDYPTLDDWRENVDKSDVNDPFRKAYEDAFNAALIKNSYGTGNENYGTLTFNKRYLDNDEYSDVENFSSYFNALRQTLGVTRNLIFPCKATDAQMKVGKTYVIALIDSQNFEVSKTIPVNFRLEDQCQSSSDFEVVFSGEVKIDGVLIADQEGKTYCKNQKPIVTIDLNGIDSKGEIYKTEQAYFDWYFGPYLLNAEETADNWTIAYSTEQKNTLLLKDALGYFRDEYPIATQEDVMKDGSSIIPTGSLTADMLSYIKQMVTEGKLALYMKSEIISTTELYNKQLGHTRFYITAIPIRPADMADDVKFCLSPFKVGINLNQNAPSMKDGDDKGIINYPADMNDVPLRIGLKQLKRTVITDLNATPTQTLWLPLREVNGSINDVTLLKKHEANRTDFDVEPAEIHTATDDLIYLAASNDPAVLAGTSGAVDITTSSSSDPMWPIISDLKVVGKVQSIKAEKGNNNGSVAKLAFLKGFKFREGYWYTLKFHYEDDYTDVTGDHPTACPGDLVFTIKVVPEYQMWTGAVSRNWNDDRNWRRVTSDELLWPASRVTESADEKSDFQKFSTYIGGDPREFIKGGKDSNQNDITLNTNKESFAPADFTKVIIPAGVQRVPYMYDARTNAVSITYTGAPSASQQLKPEEVDKDNGVIGNATPEDEFSVAYDMASINRSDNDVACRPWYDHTCDEIHFNAGAEMMDQRYLVDYNKAWCDIDVIPGSWQTVASPLMNIVAGDLYLPSATARQTTPLFEDIEYKESLNDRFKPAVFQHSWNKSKATVYELDGRNRNVGIKLDWSHVYNDVNVQYGAGQGFSIKVDVSNIAAGGTEPKATPAVATPISLDDAVSNGSIVTLCVNGQYLYGKDAQNTAMGNANAASSSKNVVVGYKVEKDGDYYLFRCVTPAGGDYGLWNSNPCYLNSQPSSTGVTFNLGKDQDGLNGSSWILENGALKSVLSGKYFNGTSVSERPVTVSFVAIAPAVPAKFRFPKADTQYTYYNPENTDGDKRTEIVNDGSKTADGADVQYGANSNAKRPGRLADLTSTFIPFIGEEDQRPGDATAPSDNAWPNTQYFLVGNPLMCALNMQAFFAKNTQFEPKYWIVTADGQRTGLFTEDGFISAGATSFVDPGVSFFVKLKSGTSNNVSPQFTPAMMTYKDDRGQRVTVSYNDYDSPNNPRPNNAKTRSANSAMPQLHMTATDVNGRQSRALLMDGTMMEHEGVETLFDSNLKDDALLYTTKDGMAKTIASIAPGDTLPLAVSGARDEVQLSIEGVKDFDFDLFLIDSEEGTVEPLEGDVVLKQDASGVRYYIATRSKDDTEVEGDVNVPRVTAKDGYITVYAPAACEIETSAIYNTGGIRLDFAEHIAESHSVKLLPGIYIVHLLCDGKTYTYKLMLR